jgi:mRNA interferase MazF
MTYEQFDVVALPFPFSDRIQSKFRPVVVLSGRKFNKSNRHVVTAMITTAKKSAWPLDVKISDLDSSGLP